jgi:hypothetical protein
MFQEETVTWIPAVGVPRLIDIDASSKLEERGLSLTVSKVLWVLGIIPSLLGSTSISPWVLSSAWNDHIQQTGYPLPFDESQVLSLLTMFVRY